MPSTSSPYLVCATPRSGSTLLCEMLRGTGLAGNPLEHFELLRHSSLPRQPREYFTDLPDPEVLELLPPVQPGERSTEPPEEWWERIVQAGRTPNGVWGGKLMWGHIPDLLSRARELPGLAGADLAVVLARLLPHLRLILVTRADKVAQAVSLWRAVQTLSWRAGGGERTAEPTYSHRAIAHLVRQLSDQERSWRAWLERNDHPALEVRYEDLDARPKQVVGSVLSALGLGAIEPPEPPLARQRDELSLSWAERFRRESGQELAA